MDKTFGIHFGALCEPISKQIEAQGLKYDKRQIAIFEKHVDYITTLRFADLLTDSIYDKINQKLFNQIRTHVIKENKLKVAKKTN